MKNRIYLDWNATAPLLPSVQTAMKETIDGIHGNASSVHRDGQQARKVLEDARRAVASTVNAPSQAVIFTGGATESNNQVLRYHSRRVEEPTILCSEVEHPSVLEVVEELGRQGVEVEQIPVDNQARLDLQWLRDRLEQGDVTLVSVMLANNEVGNIYDLENIVEIARETGVRVHTDATQGLGRIPVDFGQLGVDFMTLSFHKMGGPKGIGAIVKKEGTKIERILAGGHQERGRRPGTENVPAAAGVQAAMEEIDANLGEWNERLNELREYFLSQLSAADVEFEVRGNRDKMLPNTLNLAFPGVDGEDFLLAIDLTGVSVSSGSACTAGSLEPSHVLLAMGLEKVEAKRSVRFSFGPLTTKSELEEASRHVSDVLTRLKSFAA